MLSSVLAISDIAGHVSFRHRLSWAAQASPRQAAADIFACSRPSGECASLSIEQTYHQPGSRPGSILSNLDVQVSADGEMVLYKALVKAGITLLSIAHRPALKRFHHAIVHFHGSQDGDGWHLEELDK